MLLQSLKENKVGLQSNPGLLIDYCSSNINVTVTKSTSVPFEDVFNYHNYVNEQVFALSPYFLGFIIAMVLAIALFLLSYVLGTHLKILEKEKLSLFECGFIPLNDSRQLFFVNFYRISILFILFDIEISYLFPWTTSFYDYLLPLKPNSMSNSFLTNSSSFAYFYYVYLFLFLLSIGIVYEYKAKALELHEVNSFKKNL